MDAEFNAIPFDPVEDGEFLEHYGVKGMKWYQHLFGRDTSSGGSKRKKKSTNKVDKKTTKAKKKAAEEKRKKRVEKAKRKQERKEILKDPKKVIKNYDKLSAAEINSALKRYENMEKLKKYAGKSNFQKTMDYVKKGVEVVNLGIDTYNVAARINNTLNSDNRMPYIESVGDKKKKNKKS